FLLLSLYFPALLLLLCPLWDVSQSLPVTGKGPMTDSCVFYAKTLLSNITDVLTQNQLFTGIDCTKQNVELNMNTNTASVCAPGDSTCSGFTPSQFSQELCLTNIGEDLRYYYQFLAAQPDPDSFLGPTVLLSLKELMENCFSWSLPADSALKKASADHPSTYDERLSLCKVLKGFHVRTITINRAIGFIHSGEDTN
uniref:Interleukin-12 subunit alpha n=1 Tax=Sphaeramia orbicularis TaxID=375764 RepID=A0A673B4J8_9TELE